MNVKEMLERTSAYEITEWMAYERAFGPLDDGYTWEALAALHEQLQLACRLLGAQFDGENPAPDQQHYPRPSESFVPQEDEAELGEVQTEGGADELSRFFENER